MNNLSKARATSAPHASSIREAETAIPLHILHFCDFAHCLGGKSKKEVMRLARKNQFPVYSQPHNKWAEPIWSKAHILDWVHKVYGPVLSGDDMSLVEKSITDKAAARMAAMT